MAGCRTCDYRGDTFVAKTVGELVFCKKINKGVMPELTNNCIHHSDLKKKIKRKVVKRVLQDDVLPCDNPKDEVKRLRHLLRRAARRNADLLEAIREIRGATLSATATADRILGREC